MKLETCPACGKEVSPTAKTCPECGDNLAQRRAVAGLRKGCLGCGGVIGVLILLIAGAAIFGGSGGGKNSGEAGVPEAVTPPTAFQLKEAQLAICAAAASEYDDALAGKRDKDPIIYAGQFSAGQTAGGVAIGHELGEYYDKMWDEKTCTALTSAPVETKIKLQWGGDVISLPAGAIRLVFCREAGYCS